MTNRDPSTYAAHRDSLLLTRRIGEVLALDPTASAIAFGEQTLPWSFYSDAITDLESLLGAHPGARRVGVILRNRPGPVAAAVATIGTGRQLVTLSPQLGDDGLAADIVDLAPDVLIAEDQDWARPATLSAAERCGAIALRTGSDRALGAQPVAWTANPALRSADDIAVLMMTSGTTGRPKRIELTYDRMVAAFRAAGTDLGDTAPRLRGRPAILWASLAHISGLYFAIAYVLEGRGIALMEKFDVDAWVELVRRHRPGFVRLAPAALRMVLQAQVPLDVFKGVRAIGSGSAPLPPELAEEFEKRYGVPVLGTYGATEFAGAIAGWTLADKVEWGGAKRGSVGRAHHGIELRIVDRDTAAVLTAGAIGLLEARGRQLPGADGSWLRTTDLAAVDEDGFLFIHGRADEAINRGGFKIPPAVIEDALCRHPSVAEAAAIGLPDPRLGEVPVAAVTVSRPTTAEELMAFLASRLTRYQLPVTLKVVDALPRTPSLKVSRPLVRDRFFADHPADPAPDVPQLSPTGESLDERR
ncbi:acyl-CoA synthetase (AMP-forming)/AMP-acid ligase II [Actinocorallia herbida]|uniref:Acyl-CoA synthetase (AMP-forming)/AMP-acid ligase II n=1 Tax=Actinocorallia herbida TaxID=58109 RepID=A0A3N1D1S0_9ACTN|nr:class I adenylate-forming enzyme family protein [Actinocorallia herbida]ROO87483.1 acyl-CoA synthetase (AMP-forming)/AMP-acid ligase II [Actinocorallia herbida]